MNIADRLSAQSKTILDQIAIATPLGKYLPRRRYGDRPYRTITFRDLDLRVTRIAAGLQAMGIGKGMRIALLVRFGEDFIALVFAILRTGATIVLVDPGIGRKHLIRCLEDSNPDGLIAIPIAHYLTSIFSRDLKRKHFKVTVGTRYWGLPKTTLSDLEQTSENKFESVTVCETDSAAIIFTTGSTGPPKGVLYTQLMFNAQVDQLIERYRIVPGGKDLSCFPLFGLFNAVMGTTTILPDMNPIRPADVDPPRLLDAIDQWQINQAFGSPALWTAVGKYCQRNSRRVESLRLVLSAGAPVPPKVLERIRNAIAVEGLIYTPYGATEALPIASIESREVLEETAEKNVQGRGTCVGKKFSGIDWKLITIDDLPETHLRDSVVLDSVDAEKSIGELIVSGNVVSPKYVTREDQNALHKLKDESGRLWHRMGDVGYFDSEERFWYCGRKSHRVQTRSITYFTDPCESIVNQLDDVRRSALVGVTKDGDVYQTPVILIERTKHVSTDTVASVRKSDNGLIEEVRTLIDGHELLRGIRNVYIYDDVMPTDIRHNSKIFRERLVPWATAKLLESP